MRTDQTTDLVLRNRAWLRFGVIGSLPGIVELAHGRLAFTAVEPGTLWPFQLRKLERFVQRAGVAEKLDRGEPCELFSASLAEVSEVSFPWYTFDVAMNLNIGDKTYRLSFIQPQNTKLPKPRPDASLEGVAEVVKTFVEMKNEITDARTVGRAWKEALAPNNPERTTPFTAGRTKAPANSIHVRQ